MKRAMISVLLTAALALSLTACGAHTVSPQPTPPPTETVPVPPVAAEFALPRTGGSLNPILGSERVNLAFAGLIWEGLFALDETFTPQPVLCKSSAVAEDGLTWTLTLQSGVQFSDGTALTADDVVSSLLLAKTAPSRFAARLGNVKAVEAAGGAVVVTLYAPNGALPALLDVPIVRGTGDTPLGTGPYAVDGGALALVARSDWWQKKTLPFRRIPLKTLPEADDLISAFDTGDITLVTADLTGTNTLGYGGNYEVWDHPTTDLLFVGFNTARGPCADGALRRALAHGFDRNSVASVLYSHHAEAAALPVSPRSPLYDEAVAQALAYSPQTMETLLAEAGYTKNEEALLAAGEKRLTLTVIVNTDNGFRLKTAEHLAGELTKAGVTVILNKLAWADYQKALAAGEFDLFLGETRLTPDFDPGVLMAADGGLNFGRYADGESAALLAAFRASSATERKAAAKALYARMAQEVPVAALCFKNQSVLTQRGMVTGLSPTQQNPFYGLEQWSIMR